MDRQWGRAGVGWAAILFGATGCMSNNVPLTAQEIETERTMTEYVSRKAGCERTWYQKAFSVFFPPPCTYSVTLFNDNDAVRYDTVGGHFVVHVHGSTRNWCDADSSWLKAEAARLARQVLPVLHYRRNHDWLRVEFVAEISEGRLSSSVPCEKRLELSIADTTAWQSAAVTVMQR